MHFSVGWGESFSLVDWNLKILAIGFWRESWLKIEISGNENSTPPISVYIGFGTVLSRLILEGVNSSLEDGVLKIEQNPNLVVELGLRFYV